MTTHENTGFLYPFIESEETDATSLLGRSGRLGSGKGHRKRTAATGVARRVRRRIDRGRNCDGRALPARRQALHTGQRRQFDRRRDTGVAVQPSRAGQAGGRMVAGRRRSGGDSAWQRCRIRADLQAPDHRSRKGPRRRDRVVHLGQLRGSDDGDHRSQSTRCCSPSGLPATTAEGWPPPRISTSVSRCIRRASTAFRRATRCSGIGLWSVTQEHMARPLSEARA